jgi:transketolase
MIARLKKLENHPDELRKVYCESLKSEEESNGRLWVINCDLCSSMGLTDFAKAYPDRSLNVGVMEANGVGIAAGLSATGLIPFFNSFAIFSSRRVYDQVFLSCGYAGLNVKIVGGDPGVTATYNGGTHMSFEDVGLMRCIPGVRILEASDAVMLKSLIKGMSEHYGTEYLRIARKYKTRIYEEGSSFTIGKAVVLREGVDVSLIASGIMVEEALKAADALEQEGIDARVIDMFTIKPIDRECVLECAEKTGAIVTAENHNIIGGLGSAVAEVLSEEGAGVLARVGVNDRFGEVGELDYLMETFGLTASNICAKAKEAIAKKR